MSERETVSLRERVKSPPAPALVEAYYAPAVARSLEHVFRHEIDAHLAHALMLAECGIVDEAPIGRILAAVLDLAAQGPKALTVDYSQEDLYSYVERHLVGILGPDVGGRLHTARSRNDLNITTWRMALRERLIGVIEALARLRDRLLSLAHEHRATVMPGYTHTQHAQPISLGYYLLSVADLLQRDHKRLWSALDRCNASPLGAGALTTTGFPIDRGALAARLGFPGLVEVAYDAVSSRDDAHEAAAALAILMTGLSRLATDLQTWNTAEFGFLELADAFSSVSSIMPQKKNPQALEYTKAAAAQVTGALTAVLACSKNTAFADVNDGVTALNGPTLEACERSRQALAVMEGVLATLAVRSETMRRSAELGFGTATELADVIVRETGLSFRKAHNVVGRVVRETIEAGRTALDITAADLDQAAVALFGGPLGVPQEAVATALDPARNIASRTVIGGPAPEHVAQMIARRRHDLERDRDELTALGRDLAAVRARLHAEAQARAVNVTSASRTPGRR